MVIKQYAVHWINLDPTKGSEVSKTRPCVIISPDEMNKYLRTVIIAPLTHTLKIYPSRVLCEIKGDKGSIMLDQIRTVDRTRIGAKLCTLNSKEIAEIKFVVNQMLC
ncbi:MAG: type II toxin-antitoxin system PemK/MazF family toxin [Bacteroidota bacterium]|nr:type II toxin-antitoxin system PemK/MazF family toxin [Bacteroidota bacterium]